MTWIGKNPAAALWEDLRFPATAINPPGTAGDPTYDDLIPGWLFPATGKRTVAVAAQLSHEYKEGTNIKPHVHWMKSAAGAGDVVWELEYRWARIGEVLTAASIVTASAVIPSLTDDGAQDKHLITSFGEIDCTGVEISDMLLIRLSRLGSDGADTFSADARLVEFDIHFLKDESGSYQEGIKQPPA